METDKMIKFTLEDDDYSLCTSIALDHRARLIERRSAMANSRTGKSGVYSKYIRELDAKIARVNKLLQNLEPD